jgi:DNA-binding beta-propeller fold protein YncE
VSAIADDAAGAEPVEVRSGKLAELSVTLESPPLGGSAGTGSAGRSSGSSGSGFGGSVGSAGRGGSSGFGGSGGNPVEGLDFIDARTQVEQMLVDPSRPTLYALDRVNNSLLFIDLDSREVTKTIFVGSSPVDMDLDDEGNELFIANFGSTELAIVDLEAQEIARTIFVDPSLGTWEGNPYRIALMAENTLVFTSEDQWCDLKLVNATNGGHIAATGSLYSPDLAATADGTRLFVGESGGNLYRFDLADSMLTEADVSSAGGSRLVTLSGDEQYVFYGGQKILASNLKSVLGDFSDEIHLSNEDGSLVVSTSRVFDGTTFAIIGLLPITTPTLAASPDFTTLYLYELTSSRIYLYDLSEYAE